MTPVVFLRHGHSVWNEERRFTGWADVPLSPYGCEQAREAAGLLQAHGFSFDVAFGSTLRRSIDTLGIVLDTLALSIPVQTSWRLNERHYGALQGLRRADVAHRYGHRQVTVWQQDFDIAPPARNAGDGTNGDATLQDVAPDGGEPLTESLRDVRARVLPYWQETLVPAVMAGRRALVVAHGNSLRALTTWLDGVPERDIPRVKRPLTGEPFVYEFDCDAHPLRHYGLRPQPRAWHWVKAKVAGTVRSATGAPE